MSVRVLIVDDSAVMRALLTRKLEDDAGIEVVGTAPNAAEARRMIKSLDPDVVTLDIEMPGMDGLSFLQKIMELRPTPVIIVSGATGPGAEATARAMQLGAVSCYAKSTRHRSIADDDQGMLVRLVHEAAQVTLPAPRKAQASRPSAPSARPASSAQTSSNVPMPDLIAIGSSTGGVEALLELLAEFPVHCPPTLIVQHINACFAPAIAKSLDRVARPRVRLAEHNRPLAKGEIVIAPGDTGHLTIRPALGKGASASWSTKITEGAPVSGHCPSVDALFNAVATHVGAQALGILLTGMGRDGAQGLKAMAGTGGTTIAQDEATSVVFGMPRAAIELGAAQHVLPLGEIAPRIFSACADTQRKAS